MELSLFDYDLPEHFIAQTPIEPRDSSKLMVLNKFNGAIEHRIFRDIYELLNSGDVLVMNDTRVIPARLFAHKQGTKGQIEILLLSQLNDTDWKVIVGGRGVTTGKVLGFENSTITTEVLEELEGPQRLIRFSQPVNALLEDMGEMPLPPYIHHQLDDKERYQTVYNKKEGSAAAPTAGLHFTPELLIRLRDKGVKLAFCTLHVGLDTFQPVKVDNIKDHHIHSEWAMLDADNAKIINDAKLAGGRIIAVGTTSCRTLETAGILSAGGNPAKPDENPEVCAWRPVIAFNSNTNLYIYPGYRWRVIDAMITNFHLPKSSLMMMISAFATREIVMNAYETAKEHSYRFFSFGDAMFIHP
jgi:S-adenosylmethionine:tRNA ribosyltransferase-isomerase